MPELRAVALCNASHLQLKGLIEYLSVHEISSAAVALAVRLTGDTKTDSHLLDILTPFVRSQVVFLTPKFRGSDRLDSGTEERLRSFVFQRKISPVLGSLALQRMRAMFVILSAWLGPPWRWRNFPMVILGNLFEPTPLLRVFARKASRIVVDDGLQTITVAAFRREHRGRFLLPVILDIGGSPINWKLPFHFFTMLENLQFGIGDTASKNNMFSRFSPKARPVPRSCWILGAPLVEGDGLPRDTYFEILEEIVGQARTRFDRIEYLPHRKESQVKVDRLSQISDLKVLRGYFSVEDRVMDLGECASLVVGFESTALETLSTLTEMSCELWNIFVPAPHRKNLRGLNQPEVYAGWFAQHPRVKAVRTSEVSALIEEHFSR